MPKHKLEDYPEYRGSKSYPSSPSFTRLVGLIKEQIKDESSAADTYSRMAELADQIGYDKLVRILRGIEQDELRHRSILQGEMILLE